MPAVARKDSEDTVASPDGSGICCSSASIQSTDKGSSDVLIHMLLLYLLSLLLYLSMEKV